MCFRPFVLLNSFTVEYLYILYLLVRFFWYTSYLPYLGHQHQRWLKLWWPQPSIQAALGLAISTTTCQIYELRWQPIREAANWWGSWSTATGWLWSRPTWDTSRWLSDQNRTKGRRSKFGQLQRFGFLMLQSNAELAVRDMLRKFAQRRRQRTGSLEVESEDFMDDGTPIRLRVQINEEEVSE